MKRKITMLCLILVAAMLASCSSCASCRSEDGEFPEPSNEVRVGMKHNDVRETIKDQEAFFQLGSYLFYVGKNGNNVVVELDGKHKEIKNVKAFYPVNSNKKAFSEITEGMDIYEVVEMVGIPFRETTSGFRTSDFKAEDGSVFRIYWYESLNDNTMTVTSVIEVEDRAN